MAKLTEKQKAFINEYLVDLNATQAAIRAGYSPNGINKRVTRMMANDGIQEEIQKRMKDREKRTEISQDMVVQELAKIAFANITDFVTTDGCMVKIKPTDAIDKSKVGVIAGIKQGANGIEIKTNDKVKALELLGRHLNMFTDNIKLKSDENTEVTIKIGGEAYGD